MGAACDRGRAGEQSFNLDLGGDGAASLVEAHFVYNFYGKNGNNFMHQPLAQCVFVSFKLQGSALVQGGVGKEYHGRWPP